DSTGLRSSPRLRFWRLAATTPGTGPPRVWTSTRWPTMTAGSQPLSVRTAASPSSPRFVTTTPIPSMWPTSRSDGPPAVPGTRTDHEVSVVCRDHDVPEGESVDRGWTVLEVMGPLDFSLSGVVASLVAPLAERDLPIFVISTFESDYVLIRSTDLARAADALED